MTTKPVTGIDIKVDKSGRTVIVKKPTYSSVSDKIRAAKSQRTKVVRRSV